MLIINAEQLYELNENNNLFFAHKKFKSQHYFFISPKLGFKLYDCKVSYISKDYCILKFDKIKYLTAKIMILNIQKALLNLLNKNFNDIKESEFYDILYEKNDECFLKIKGNIQTFKRDQSLENIAININNIWYDQTKKQGGYNLII